MRLSRYACSASILFLSACANQAPQTVQELPSGFKVQIGLICPSQVPPIWPAQAVRERISGKVVAEAKISGGKVVDVTILSGPEVFREAVVTAMKKYKCVEKQEEVVSEQSFTFLIE